jgi:hypothetical protein
MQANPVVFSDFGLGVNANRPGSYQLRFTARNQSARAVTLKSATIQIGQKYTGQLLGTVKVNRRVSLSPGEQEIISTFVDPSEVRGGSQFLAFVVDSYELDGLTSGKCDFEWQTAADGKRCGNRAANRRPGGR